MARKTLAERRSEKLEELDRIRNDLARLEEKAAAQIGKIAIRAGLGDLDVDDEQLAKEFAALAAKFLTKQPKKSQPSDANTHKAGEN